MSIYIYIQLQNYYVNYLNRKAFLKYIYLISSSKVAGFHPLINVSIAIEQQLKSGNLLSHLPNKNYPLL